MQQCPSCGKDWPEDRFNAKFPDCFQCRARTLRVAFAGGKAQFHGTTIKESNEKQIKEARAAGFDPVPVGYRTFAGGTASGAGKLKDALVPKSVSAETTKVG